MITEYAGIADRWAGGGVVHNVRAWWHVTNDSEAEVKKSALRLVRREINATDHATVEPLSADTYNYPRLNALVRVRVLTQEEHAERKRLSTITVDSCALCGSPHPGNYLRMADQSESFS